MEHGQIEASCCLSNISVFSRIRTLDKYAGPSSSRGAHICQDSCLLFLLRASVVESGS